MIGAGIFALPAVAAARAGSFALWLFVICALMIFTVVLALARAASFVSNTGGPIAYATVAFGTFAGFQTGWLYYLSRVAAMAANTNLLVTYAALYWARLEAGPVRWGAIVLVLAGLTAVNLVGVRQSLIAVYALTLCKLAPLALLILVGLPRLELGLLTAFEPPALVSLGETILILLYAFIGFESAVVPAGEARDPRRDIPRALVGTVLAITVVYVLVQWVTMSVLPGVATSERPLADAAEALLGPFGAILLSLGAVFSIGGNCSASMMSSPRMTYAMARDGSLPRWFSTVHAVHRTPTGSILFYGVASVVLALSGTFIWLAVISTLARLLMYAVSIVALPRLERLLGTHEGQFRIPGGPAAPILALILCAWLVTHASASAWMATLALMALGSLLYWLARHHRREMEA